MTGIQQDIKDDLWLEAFETHFAAGYAMAVSEFHDRLGQETHGFAPMPHSFAGERAVLGCALMDQNVRPQILETLSGDDFFVDIHRLIFLAIKGLCSKGDPVTPVSVTAEMSKQRTLESAGGPGQLRQAANNVPDVDEAVDLIKLIKQKSMLRQIIVTAKGVMMECYADVGPTDSSIDQLETTIKIFKMIKQRRLDGPLIPRYDDPTI